MRTGDRLEHASVCPPEFSGRVAELGLVVVTQPNFIAERGDRYLIEVEPDDQPWLYRGAGFTDAGIAWALGTDAPFGNPNPWLSMHAAVERRTAAGAVIGREERVTPEAALARFSTPADDPAGNARTVAVGERADLCLLSQPWHQARNALEQVVVTHTWIGGALVGGSECPD